MIGRLGVDSFWQWFWVVVVALALVGYLCAMFAIVVDLFRDHTVSGVVKAVWLLLFLLFPILTPLAYLLVRGGGMAERSRAGSGPTAAADAAYIRERTGTSSAEQLAQATRLLEAGAISEEEFAALKARALA